MLVSCLDKFSPIPKHFVHSDVGNVGFVRFVVNHRVPLNDIVRVIQSVPAIVARVTNAVDITSFIVEGILVGAVMTGLLNAVKAPNDWELPATTVLAHFPLARCLGI